jgi:putative ABC transport system permease protein
MMRFVSALGRDARHGLRSLAGSSRYTVVALSTVVLMVGGITTIYSLVNSVLLRPLPYPTPDRLAWIESRQPGGFGSTVALRDIRAFQQGGRSFDAWGLYRIGYVTSVFDPNREPVSVQDMRVSPDLFPILGIETALGRALLESDTAPGAPDVALISYDLWQSLFSGRADVLGTSLQVWKSTATIVGVTAKDTKLPMNGLTYPIVWRPVRDATDSAVSFTTIARLRPGVSVAQARAELAVAGEALAAAQPDTHKGRVTTPTLLLDAVVGDYKRVLWIFFGAVSCVLLIGVGNLMSLQLARNGGRERELSVRTALGASRGQIVRQLLVESSILSIAGGVLGLALAWPAIQSIVSTLPRNFPRASQIGIDVGVAVFACAISLVVGVVVGMVPAWRASRIDLAARLNESGRSATLGRQRGRLQRVLIALETAVALILLIGAALLANSFQRLISRDAGMQEEDLWTVRATLPSRVRDNAAQTAFWTSALDEVRKLPGVQSAAIIVNSRRGHRARRLRRLAARWLARERAACERQLFQHRRHAARQGPADPRV